MMSMFPLLIFYQKWNCPVIYVDAEELAKYSIELTENLDNLEKEVYFLCGKEFNLKSTKQLQEVLFTDRKLTPTKKTKTGYSTDTSVLQELAKEDPVPEKNSQTQRAG